MKAGSSLHIYYQPWQVNHILNSAVRIYQPRQLSAIFQKNTNKLKYEENLCQLAKLFKYPYAI
jgi:hypothetical protein